MLNFAQSETQTQVRLGCAVFETQRCRLDKQIDALQAINKSLQQHVSTFAQKQMTAALEQESLLKRGESIMVTLERLTSAYNSRLCSCRCAAFSNGQEKSIGSAKSSTKSGKRTFGKEATKVSGRRPQRAEIYAKKSESVIEKLTALSRDKNLTVTERKKYRSQKYALKRRVAKRLGGF